MRKIVAAFFCTHITKYTNRREWSRIKGTRKVQSRDFAPHTWTLKSSTLDSIQLIVRSVVVELRVSWKLSSINSFSNHEGKSILTLQKNGLQWEMNEMCTKTKLLKKLKKSKMWQKSKILKSISSAKDWNFKPKCAIQWIVYAMKKLWRINQK